MPREDRRYIPAIKIQNAKIITAKGWRGFGPDGDKYGHRGFSLLIDPEDAQELIDFGWNIHIMPARDEGGEPGYRLPVTVKFKDYPPEVVMVTRRGAEVQLDNESIECLDHAYLKKINVTIVPYIHGDTSRGGTGVTAYLSKMKVWVEEDKTMDDDESPWED